MIYSRLIIWERKDVEESTIMSIKAIWSYIFFSYFILRFSASFSCMCLLEYAYLSLSISLTIISIYTYICIYTYISLYLSFYMHICTIHSLLFFTHSAPSKGEEKHIRVWVPDGRAILEWVCYNSQPISLKIIYTKTSTLCLSLGKYFIKGSIIIISSQMWGQF